MTDLQASALQETVQPPKSIFFERGANNRFGSEINFSGSFLALAQTASFDEAEHPVQNRSSC